MSEQELPDWVQPGATVAVWETTYSQPTVTLRKVERETKTQIVLDNGERYRKEQRSGTFGTFPRIGDRGNWTSYAYLRDPASPEVRQALHQAKVRNKAWKLRQSTERFPNDLTAEAVQKVISLAKELREMLLIEEDNTPS